jgi:hypothetical protein
MTHLVLARKFDGIYRLSEFRGEMYVDELSCDRYLMRRKRCRTEGRPHVVRFVAQLFSPGLPVAEERVRVAPITGAGSDRAYRNR